jgi:O-antigen/teichoic acid export membrane protein
MSAFDAVPRVLARLRDESFPRGSVRRRLARGTFWTLAGTCVVQLGGIAASIAVARILGQTGFGELGMVRSTVLMLGVLAGTGLGMAATKYVAEYRDSDPARAGRLIGLLLNVAMGCGGLAAILCFLLASALAVWVMGAEQLADPLRFGCLLILLNAVNGVQVGTLSGLEAFRTTAWISILDAVFNLIFMVSGGWLFGVAGALGGYVLAAAAAFPVKKAAMMHACHRASIVITRRGVTSELSALWVIALPSVLLGVVTLPFEWLARVILTHQTNGYAELGSLLAAYSWGQAVLFLPNQVSAPTLPLLANLWSTGDRKRFHHTMAIAFTAAAATSIGGLAILMALRGNLMSLYGKPFISAAPVLTLIASAYAVGGATLPFRALLVSSGKVWLLLLSACVWGGVFIVSSIVWAGNRAIGIGSAYLLAFGVYFVIVASMSVLTLRMFNRKTVMGRALAPTRVDILWASNLASSESHDL